MVLFALDQQERGLLGAHVVVTSMSNLGLHRAFGAADISLLITDVGDRNVLMALEKHDLNFGGEQSGHLIFRSQSPTGDGMLTGLMLCDLVARKGALEDLVDNAWKRVPQAIINIPLDEYSGPFVADTYQRLKSEYSLQGSDVRIVSRPSGTEPVFRVMVESVSEDFVRAFRNALVQIELPRGPNRS
jgi:phosphoglucosamine mutase